MCKELDAVGQKKPALQNEKSELDIKKLEIEKLKAAIAKQKYFTRTKEKC